eukprot:3838899-Amphidinium_carterae.1
MSPGGSSFPLSLLRISLQKLMNFNVFLVSQPSNYRQNLDRHRNPRIRLRLPLSLLEIVSVLLWAVN